MKSPGRVARLRGALLATIVILTVGMLRPDGGAADPVGLDDAIRDAAKQVAAGLSDPALVKKVPGASGLVLAVPDIATIEKQRTLLGRYVAEELITSLFQGGVAVVERSLLDRALDELKLGTTDLMSSGNQKRFGQFVGADAVLVGSLADVGSAIDLNIRVVFVEEGIVLAGGKSALPKDPWVSRAYAQVVESRGLGTQ